MWVLSMQFALFMSPSWKTGSCILNADNLPWQHKLICILPSVLRYSFGIHISTVHTQRFFCYILVIKRKILLLTSKLPTGMHASKVLKHIKNVQDKHCVQVTRNISTCIWTVLKYSPSNFNLYQVRNSNNTTYRHEHSTLLGSTEIHKNWCLWLLPNLILCHIFYLQLQANS
jgi:hypothetical protein